jgi:hypothetical protein
MTNKVLRTIYAEKTPQQGQELLEARHQLKPEAIAI